MDNLTNGTEVLLFKNTTNDIHKDTKKYIKGIVIGSYTEASLLVDNTPIYRSIYTIYGENGEEYNATLHYADNGKYFIRTIPEHIDYLLNNYHNNNVKIDELKKRNNEIKQDIVILNSSYKNKKVKTKVK